MATFSTSATQLTLIQGARYKGQFIYFILKAKNSGFVGHLPLKYSESESNEVGDIESQPFDEVYSETTENVTQSEEEEILTDPRTAATQAYEKELSAQVKEFETLLRSERLLSSRVKDKLSESGKAGYFIVQAQVNDFLRKSETQQKDKVVNNKREFVTKMLPVVDAFRAAPLVAPATTETEENMHKAYSALLTGILAVINKYGFKEFVPEIGDTLDPIAHEIESVITVEDGADGTVAAVLRPGMYNVDGSVLRRALVMGVRNASALLKSVGFAHFLHFLVHTFWQLSNYSRRY
eukprot:gene11736-24616_t